jgi:hypothetical protein
VYTGVPRVIIFDESDFTIVDDPHTGIRNTDIDPDNDIEEYELDSEEEPDWFKNGYKTYYCWSDRSNEVKCRELYGSELSKDDEEENARKAIWTNLPGLERLCVSCKARSRDHAIKIAADKFAQYRYEQLL